MNVIRQFYYDDLYNRGGVWITAANNFKLFTSDTMTNDQIYEVYLCVYNSVVAGGDGSSCGPPDQTFGSKLWPWLIVGGLIAIAAVFIGRKKG